MVIYIENNKEINLILQGGGVKGLAYIGALRCFEEYGYKVKNISGSSIGAVIGCLIIAGYNSYELEQIINNLDYSIFTKRNNLKESINRKGLFTTKHLEYMLTDLLLKKGIRTFKDIKVGKNYKAIFTCTSLKHQRIFVLPYDLKLLNIDPDTFLVSQAAMMSASLPFFYEPFKLKDEYFYDGGMSDNYPLWCFKEGIALKLSNENKYHKIFKETIFGKINNHNYIQQIYIDTKEFKATEVKKGFINRYKLFNKGYYAVKQFIMKSKYD